MIKIGDERPLAADQSPATGDSEGAELAAAHHAAATAAEANAAAAEVEAVAAEKGGVAIRDELPRTQTHHRHGTQCTATLAFPRCAARLRRSLRDRFWQVRQAQPARRAAVNARATPVLTPSVSCCCKAITADAIIMLMRVGLMPMHECPSCCEHWQWDV